MSKRSLAANVMPASGPPAAPAIRNSGPWTKGLVKARAPGGVLRDLDQLQRFAARALDHHRARVAELVGLFEEADALASQLGDPGVEVGDAEGDVIVELPTRAHERTIALTHVPEERHVAERDRGRRRPEHALAFERRPAAIGPARHLTGGLGQWRAARAPRKHRRVEVLAIPELRTERIVLEQMHVVEALGRMVAGVFYEGMV